ncbi:hypothetical protein RJ55_02829 [Drechmeria coniospora]|nr:hypothetical protein RJ55_02829 [Drechmeria coniospora]
MVRRRSFLGPRVGVEAQGISRSPRRYRGGFDGGVARGDWATEVAVMARVESRIRASSRRQHEAVGRVGVRVLEALRTAYGAHHTDFDVLCACHDQDRDQDQDRDRDRVLETTATTFLFWPNFGDCPRRKLHVSTAFQGPGTVTLAAGNGTTVPVQVPTVSTLCYPVGGLSKSPASVSQPNSFATPARCVPWTAATSIQERDETARRKAAAESP